jgi:DNA modification methylase
MLTQQVIQGDGKPALQTLPGESVDFVLTDPPYFVRYKDRSGRSIANDDQPESVLGAFNDLYRVLKPNTFSVSFYGWNSIAAFFEAWKQAGFTAVGHIIWHKSYSSHRGFLNARHEQAYVLVKGHPAAYSADRERGFHAIVNAR